MARRFRIKSNEFGIIIDNRIEEKGIFSKENFLKAVKNVFQRHYGTPDDIIFEKWIKSFNKPIGYEHER